MPRAQDGRQHATSLTNELVQRSICPVWSAAVVTLLLVAALHTGGLLQTAMFRVASAHGGGSDSAEPSGSTDGAAPSEQLAQHPHPSVAAVAPQTTPLLQSLPPPPHPAPLPPTPPPHAPAPLAGAYYRVAACEPFVNKHGEPLVECASTDDATRAAVRCCEAPAVQPPPAAAEACFGSICVDGGRSGHGGAGHAPLYRDVDGGNATLRQAMGECVGRGKRLCSRDELVAGACCGFGCYFDMRMVWSRTPCYAAGV